MAAARALHSPFLAALRGERPSRIPVWFMRQAGRSLPEYRALRAHGGLLELARVPELAAQATLQPVLRHGVDAAILFSDIVVPLAAIGVAVEVRPGVGPVIATPVRSAGDLRLLRRFEPSEDAPWLAEAVALAVAELEVPLIAFAGAPFTLASYLIEGGPSKTHAQTKSLMLSEPQLWRALLERLCDLIVASLTAQVRAGAAAVQIFDSWIGSLAAAQYERHVLGVLRELFARLAALDVPRIYFGLGAGHLLEPIARIGPDAVSVDWRTPLRLARAILPDRIALQGNLDPAACLAPEAVVEREVGEVLAAAPASGYVFNLGHGVLPETRPETLTRIVELVHAHEPGSAGTGAAIAAADHGAVR